MYNKADERINTYSDTCDGVNADVMRGMVMGTEMIMRAHKSMILPPLSTVCSTFGFGGKKDKTKAAVCD